MQGECSGRLCRRPRCTYAFVDGSLLRWVKTCSLSLLCCHEYPDKRYCGCPKWLEFEVSKAEMVFVAFWYGKERERKEAWRGAETCDWLDSIQSEPLQFMAVLPINESMTTNWSFRNCPASFCLRRQCSEKGIRFYGSPRPCSRALPLWKSW